MTTPDPTPSPAGCILLTGLFVAATIIAGAFILTTGSI